MKSAIHHHVLSKYLLHQRNKTNLNFVIAFSIICNIIKPDDQGASKCKFIQPTLKLEAHMSQNSKIVAHFEFKRCSWQGVLDTTLCDKVCQ